MKKIVIATKNKGKVREMREALSHLKDTPRSMGFCHAYWSRLSDALSDRGIDWRSPALMNPRCMFD